MVTHRWVKQRRSVGAVSVALGAACLALTLAISTPTSDPGTCGAMSTAALPACVAASAQAVDRGSLWSHGFTSLGIALLALGAIALARTASLSVEEVVARTMTPMSKIKQMVASGRLVAYRVPTGEWRVLRRSVRDLS